ncbi:MAG: hypothetical protein HOQ24_12555 [Mycobacteriaceae bacterium]|nr:hypothetical protein [Mycobacteriaceae bacterium]
MITGTNWGATESERMLPLDCDSLLPKANGVAHRAVSIATPPSTVFPWLCQLRVAPYSYDLLDNFGKRSPRVLIPGMVNLEVGQRFMVLFSLSSFVVDRHITLRSERVAVTYALLPTETGSRLVVRVRAVIPAAGLLTAPLALGDLFMMRKQLHTLKSLAERTGSHDA